MFRYAAKSLKELIVAQKACFSAYTHKAFEYTINCEYIEQPVTQPHSQMQISPWHFQVCFCLRRQDSNYFFSFLLFRIRFFVHCHILLTTAIDVVGNIVTPMAVYASIFCTQRRDSVEWVWQSNARLSMHRRFHVHIEMVAITLPVPLFTTWLNRCCRSFRFSVYFPFFSSSLCDIARIVNISVAIFLEETLSRLLACNLD